VIVGIPPFFRLVFDLPRGALQRARTQNLPFFLYSSVAIVLSTSPRALRPTGFISPGGYRACGKYICPASEFLLVGARHLAKPVPRGNIQGIYEQGNIESTLPQRGMNTSVMQAGTDGASQDVQRVSRVKGPGECGEGVIAECLDFANQSEEKLRLGDELDLDNLIDVLDGFVLSATIVEGKPSKEICDKLSLNADDFELKIIFRARVRADAAGAEKPAFHVLVRSTLKQKAEDWVSVRSSVESRLRGGEIVHVFELYYQSWEGLWCLTPDSITQVTDDEEVEVLSSKEMNRILEKYQNRPFPVEGVVILDQAVNDELLAELRRGVAQIVKNQPIPDYHPGTRNIVLDIVHPSLFPYVEGASKLVAGAQKPTRNAQPEYDFWGRKYEDSRFQWLPALFGVSADGRSVKIKSYINNLSEHQHKDMYAALERLFAIFVPEFEDVYSYIKAVKFHGADKERDLLDDTRVYEPDLAGASLRGQDLRVITKIVSYELREGSEFDGVWHVEGMSHENIIATGLYILDRDDEFGGGDLMFKRAFLDFEASNIFTSVQQVRHTSTENWISEGLVPLGSVDTPARRLIVFPNSHVHKLSRMFRMESSTKEVVRRTIIVFWLVNPENTTMLTTNDLLPQQSVMSMDDALRYRLELMEERKRHKQDWNIREIELCEH
jgi:hypothetical protein